jgi:hypothetical protein
MSLWQLANRVYTTIHEIYCHICLMGTFYCFAMTLLTTEDARSNLKHPYPVEVLHPDFFFYTTNRYISIYLNNFLTGCQPNLYHCELLYLLAGVG